MHRFSFVGANSTKSPFVYHTLAYNYTLQCRGILHRSDDDEEDLRSRPATASAATAGSKTNGR